MDNVVLNSVYLFSLILIVIIICLYPEVAYLLDNHFLVMTVEI